MDHSYTCVQVLICLQIVYMYIYCTVHTVCISIFVCTRYKIEKFARAGTSPRCLWDTGSRQWCATARTMRIARHTTICSSRPSRARTRNASEFTAGNCSPCVSLTSWATRTALSNLCSTWNASDECLPLSSSSRTAHVCASSFRANLCLSISFSTASTLRVCTDIARNDLIYCLYCATKLQYTTVLCTILYNEFSYLSSYIWFIIQC